MSQILIELAEGRAYPVRIEASGLEGLGAAIRDVIPDLERVHIVTNPVVGSLYLEDAVHSLQKSGLEVEQHCVADGEGAKTVETWHGLVEALLRAKISRREAVVSLGGGVTGDIAGFAASTVMRGVRCIQVPTTLLAMVDSAVGGKTGVNGVLGKNLIGTFHQPSLVFAGLDVLRTLDDEEWRCGLGEVLKHAVIADEALFEFCEAEVESILCRSSRVVEELVRRSCAVKAKVVAEDELESGWRKILNFGHTVGHAVESALGHGTLRHGECVGLGMLAETAWAVDQGRCDVGLLHRLQRLMAALGMCCAIPKVPEGALGNAIAVDKKREGGTIELAVPLRIGEVRLHRLPMAEVEQMLNWVPVAAEEK